MITKNPNSEPEMALWSFPPEIFMYALDPERPVVDKEKRKVRFSIEEFRNLSSKCDPDPISVNMDIGFTLNMQSKFRVNINFQREIRLTVGERFDGETNSETYMSIYCGLISSVVPEGTILLGKFKPKILKANGKVFYSREEIPMISFNSLKKEPHGFQRFVNIDVIQREGDVLKNDTLLMEIGITMYKISRSSDLTTGNEASTEDVNFKKLFKDVNPVPIKSSVGRDLVTLLQSGDLSDVDLCVKGKIFKVHRCILAARSPVFLALFKSPMLESKTGKVQTDDIEPEVMAILLTYIYSGKLPKLESWEHQVRNVVYASEKYNLSELSSYLDTTIKDKILTSKNMKEIGELADTFRLCHTRHRIKKLNSKSKKKSS